LIEPTCDRQTDGQIQSYSKRRAVKTNYGLGSSDRKVLTWWYLPYKTHKPFMRSAWWRCKIFPERLQSSQVYWTTKGLGTSDMLHTW